MSTSWTSVQGQAPSAWPLALLFLAALLGQYSLLSSLSASLPILPLARELDLGAAAIPTLLLPALFLLLPVLLFLHRRAMRTSTLATQPPPSSPLPSSSSHAHAPRALPTLAIQTPRPDTTNSGGSHQTRPSLQQRRKATAGMQQLELLPSLLPCETPAPEAEAGQASPRAAGLQIPSPSALRRGSAMASAALMATVMCSTPSNVGANSKVISSAGVPVADYFEPEHEGSLRLWLKPSGTMPRNTGRVSRVHSSSNFALAKNASPQASAYVGLTIVVGGQSRLVSAYTGDINGDGDVLDAGEAEVYLDDPITSSPLVAGSTSYKILEGFSVALPAEASRVTKAPGQGNDMVQWASAARTVVLAGEVWARAEETDRVVLGPSALDVDGAYQGMTMVIGSELRAITQYDGHSRAATVAPSFTEAPRTGAGYKIVRPHAARVMTMPQLEGNVLDVSPFSPTMRFQIHPRMIEPAELPVDFTGHEITVTTGPAVETAVILAHTPDGFVSVTALASAASNASTFVVHGARPTLTAGGRTGLQGYGAVALDGQSSFLTFDSAVASAHTKVGSFPRLNSTTSPFVPHNCSTHQRECSVSGLVDSNSDASQAVRDKWSLTFLSVVRPAEDHDYGGVIAPITVVSGTLAVPDKEAVYHSGANWVRLGHAANAEQNLYTGSHVRLMLLDGSKVDRGIVGYSIDRRAELDEPVPFEMMPSKTRFFVINDEPTTSAMTLGSEAPFKAGALVGMQIAVAGDWRTITHHGSRPYSSDGDGRVVTLDAPLSRTPVAGSTRYRLVGARRLLSLDSAKAHLDVGVGRIKSKEAGEPPLVYDSTIEDGQVHSVSVTEGGSGYVCGGVFDVEVGGSSWHLGTFACGDDGSISSVTMLKNAPTVHAGDKSLERAFRYPSSCNGKTKDTSRCAQTPQHSSVSALRVHGRGSNYIPGEVRAVSGQPGSGFSAEFLVDDSGAIVDYQIPNAMAHGSGYSARTQVELVYRGTSTPMSGSVTSVDVLEGGSGHTEGPLVVSCEGGCAGNGLAGVCYVDAIGAVTHVMVTSHGQGYTQEDPPSLSCGYAGSQPLIIANVASGAHIQVIVASGVVLAADRTREESSASVSARVSRVLPGKGVSSGCSVGDELLGVGGGGRGLVVHVAEVSSAGEILKVQLHNSGSGYSAAPRLVAKNRACHCNGHANMDACWTSEISHVVPASQDWQIQAVIVDGERGVMHHYVGGLQSHHRMSTVSIGQTADVGLDFATLGARRATQEGDQMSVSKLWKGDLAEVLVYQCSASSSGGTRLGCTTPADLDRLGRYLANKFQLRWEAAAGLTQGIAGAAAGPDHALSVVEGKAGAGSVPLLRSVHPRFAQGSASQTITVSGRYFGGPGDEDAVQVRVGNEPCMHLKLLPAPARTSFAASNSSTTMTSSSSASDESVAVCVVSAGAVASSVDVTVVAWGVTGVLPNAFRHGAPAIHSLLPSRVLSRAGTVLTIIGTNLDSSLAFTVKLESHTTALCSETEVVSANELKCTLPQLLRADTRVVIAVDDQGEQAIVSSVDLEVMNVPAFYTECPLKTDEAGQQCMTCCMRSCQRWQLSPEGNNRALGGAYYDHCADECSQRVCPSGSAFFRAAALPRS